MREIIAGIYKITNTINSKVYIGQSRNIYSRWYAHRYREHNEHLRNAVTRYGQDAFEFEILTVVPRDTENLSAILNDLEIYYSDLYSSHDPVKGYNLKGCGDSRTHSEETKRKISETKRGKPSPKKGTHISDDQKLKDKLAHLGKKTSEETKQKQRIASTGRKHTKEAIQKMREKQKGKIRSIEAREANRQGHLGLKQTRETIEKRRETMRRKKLEKESTHE